MTTLAPDDTLGIVGGGQLARMLAMAAARFGLRVAVLEPDPTCPAAQVASEHLVAPYDDVDAIDRLAERCPVVTYEFENVPAVTAERLAARTTLRPGEQALRVSQERLDEKRFLAGAGLATAPFAAIDGADDIGPALEAVGLPAILKTRRLGYDGKGQRLVEHVPADQEAATALWDELGAVPLIAEGLVDFDCEISVIAARSVDGDVRCFDPARNHHHGGILRRSDLPAGVDREVRERAGAAASDLLVALDYVGVLGLELFVTPDGDVLANEFAPRVHNSGHWTEHASVCDQFEQHVRAVAGLTLGDPTSRSCEMVNLIGDDVERWPELAAAGWRVHLYGKSEVRPGRKMGHATRLR